MKRLLTLLALLLAMRSYGQLPVVVYFDDTSYHQLITIDTLNYHGRQWQVGSPHKTIFNSAVSAPNVIITDTTLPYTADTSVFIMRAPAHILTGYDMPYLWGIGFMYMLDADTGAMAKVELSCNNGATWHDMTRDTSGFYFQNGFSWSAGLNLDSNVVTTPKQMYIIAFGGHDSLVADTCMFRFTFAANSNTGGHEGWMIDNIQAIYYEEGAVSNASNGSDLGLYPNPAGNWLWLTCNQPLTCISVYDIAGKQVLRRLPRGCKDLQLDIAALPPGVYTLLVNGRGRRQFVKQ